MSNAQQRMIEDVWASALVQLQHGGSEIVVGAEMRDVLGQQGIAAIADRFRYLFRHDLYFSS